MPFLSPLPMIGGNGMENDDLDIMIRGGGRKNNGFLKFIKAELWLLLTELGEDMTAPERALFLLLDADHQIQEILDAAER